MDGYIILLVFIGGTACFFGGFCIATMLAEITFLKGRGKPSDKRKD